VATFQLIIYEGPRVGLAQQGNVEFRYNNVIGPTLAQINSSAYADGQVIQNPRNDQSAVVGFKGNTEISYELADFVNCMYNGFDTINYPADV
jgi:hypothetical protein